MHDFGKQQGPSAPSPYVIGFLVALAAGISIAGKGYRFDGPWADDSVQAPLVLHRIDPELLASDPLIRLVAEPYQSVMFDLVAALAPVMDIPAAYFALFLVARALAFAAMYRLALTLTRSPLAAVAATFLLAGSFVHYCGGIAPIEGLLTPRGFALPLALFAFDAFLRRRMGAMTLWLCACLFAHPVTGVNFIGVIAFCGLFSPNAAPRKAFLGALAIPALATLLVAGWTGRWGADAGGLRFDTAWREVIEQTVGPWVYLQRTPPLSLATTVWILLCGSVGVATAGSREFRALFATVSLASFLALWVHFIGVDVLDIRLLLYASPQRATAVWVFCSVAALGLWLEKAVRHPDPVVKALALAFFLASVAFSDLGIEIVFGLSLALAWSLRNAGLPTVPRACAAAALVASTLFFTWPSAVETFSLKPDRLAERWARLRSLGLDDDWVAVQTHIRLHSKIGDVVMPPLALSPRVFAQRPSTLTWKMRSYTHLSKPYALEFAAWTREVATPMLRASTAEAIGIARRAGASWLVLDDRVTPERAGDPAPDFRAGPYRAFDLAQPRSPGVAGGAAPVSNPSTASAAARGGAAAALRRPVARPNPGMRTGFSSGLHRR